MTEIIGGPTEAEENLFPPSEPEPELPKAEVDPETGLIKDDLLDMLLDTFAPASEVTEWVNACIFGSFGTRKTTWAATAPAPLIVRADPDGTMSLINHPQILAKATVMKYKGFGHLEILCDKMDEYPEKFEKYQTIVLDTVGAIQAMDLKTLARKAAETDFQRNRYVIETEDYQLDTAKMIEIVDRLGRMDKHIILICHDKIDKDKAQNMYLRPDLTPKLAAEVGRVSHFVGFMTLQGEGNDAVHIVQTQPTPGIVAKTRIGGLPFLMENSTFQDVIDQHHRNIEAAKL